MTTVEILNTIKFLKGATEASLIEFFQDEPALILKEQLSLLQDKGEISYWKGKYYPVTRALGIIGKGQVDALDEIELSGLKLDEIKKYFTALPDDPLYYYGYDITEAQVDLVKKYTEIDLDFENYDYYLCTWLETFPD